MREDLINVEITDGFWEDHIALRDKNHIAKPIIFGVSYDDDDVILLHGAFDLVG